MKNIRKTVLDNGLRLLSEKMPGAASVALGIWVDAGARDESPEENGLAHLIEHMVFKGTPGRDKTAIAREIDRQGGQANAFTSREQTCYHTRVRPEDLESALDLLVDIFQNSLYDEAELELEKRVIQQEIAMIEDEPEEMVHDLAAAGFWPGHHLGRPVAGTRLSVAALKREQILIWLDRQCPGPRLVISAAGAVEHQRLADLLSVRLKARPALAERLLEAPESRYGLTVRRRRLEQAHMVIRSDFPEIEDDRRQAAAVLSRILGDGFSSRLFQEIRERRGLAYSVYSSYSAFLKAGALEIYAATSPERAARTRDLVLAELKRLRREAPGAAELNEAVEGLITGLILGSETVENRMSRLAKNELLFGRAVSLAETCRRLKAVSREDLRELADQYWAEDRLAVCVLGPLSRKDFE
ncbi:MAG: insulinase family protein [Candidatus Adiutrix sp.]|jgi:predicted Zn-dependent peptidase|nr:insulinase family protein [Candidatus Adiutrix sp.]